MKYNRFSFLSLGLIFLDIFFYVFLLIMDLKNISFGDYGFITTIYILPGLAFLCGLIAILRIRKTGERGKSIAQLSMIPFVLILILTYLTIGGR